MVRRFDSFHGDSMRDDITVFRKDDGGELTGTLRLAGPDTRVDVLSDYMPDRESTVEGWFDLTVYKDHRVNGRDPVLLHNAMFVGQSGHHRDLGAWRLQIYPNYIVYGADALGEGHKIDTISFALEKLHNFFAFDDTESHNVRNLDDDAKASILDIVRTHTENWLAGTKGHKRDRNQDFSEPRRVHFDHDRPVLPNLQVSGREYNIDGFCAAGRPSENILAISLPVPVSIKEAVALVHAWSWFFNQIAFEQLDLQALSARQGERSDFGDAEFYLPSYIRREPKPHNPHLFPGNIPFSNWSSVEKFRGWMKAWLEKSDERYSFRLRLNGCLPGTLGSDAITQIGNLCGAVDSLNDFDGESAFSREVRKAMIDAAHDCAVQYGHTLKKSRLSGLMGVLNKTSLGDKIRGVLKVARPQLRDKELHDLTKHILRLRQSAAHGQTLADQLEPMAIPLMQVLSSACTIYDLVTCADGVEGFDPKILLAGQTFQFGYDNFLTLRVAIRRAEAKHADTNGETS